MDSYGVGHGFLREIGMAILATFDVPGAGTGAGQGTSLRPIGEGAAITGYYLDTPM